MIKAPYNFVPLSEKVVFPQWSDSISIDCPFEDGISGTIEVKYTAQTPLFIGNGKEGNDSQIQNYRSANGQYAIPGSSLRGMVRSIVEISSFGKFNRVENSRLSVRDLNNRDLYSKRLTIEHGSRSYEAKAKAGWLKIENKVWTLYPVEHHRVEDSDLADFYRAKLFDFEKRTERDGRLKLIGSPKVCFATSSDINHRHHEGMILWYSKVERLDRNPFRGSKPGFVVLTGQAGRFKGRVKHMDFVFEEKTGQAIEVDKSIVNLFCSTNAPKASDQKKGLDLKRELSKYEKKGYPGIPVFYLKDEKGNLHSLGLSQMYRFPYDNSFHDAIGNTSKDHFSEKMDLSECIFGKIGNTPKDSLRGRVQFEDAVSENASLCSLVETILGNPKPSFYPNYIQQQKSSTKYSTLMDKDVRLRGWKRYPVRDEENPLEPDEGQKNVASRFCPFAKGSEFQGRIHFHNLKKEELGAIIWVLTWGNDKKLSHSIGMGKSYGYGQVKAELMSVEYLENSSEGNEYLLANDDIIGSWKTCYEKYMGEEVSNWSSSSQLRELRAMADPQNASRFNWDLSHMSLGSKDFTTVKKKENLEFLSSYSENQQDSHLNGRASSQGNYYGSGNTFKKGNGYNYNKQQPQNTSRPEPRGITGSIQTGILLEEKTKKGKFKAKLKNDEGISGTIMNSEALPADIQPGTEIKVLVKLAQGNQSNFEYKKQ